MNSRKGLCITILLFGVVQAFAQQPLKLWYKQPAQKWTDALPIGNGRIGGMIYGAVAEDHIQYNEQTLWTGGPRDYNRKGAVKYLEPIRKLLAEGKQTEAEAMAQQHFMGMKSNEATYAVDSAKWFNMMSSYHLPQDVLFHDNNLRTINLPIEQGWEITPGFEGLDGAVWFIKHFNIPSGWKGKNIVISLGRIRDIDRTWLNGDYIGTTSGNAYRKYIIPSDKVHIGKNRLAVQVVNFYDKGGFTSNAKTLSVYPEGSESDAISLAGQWKYFIQDDNPPAYPRYNADYQPFADLYLQFPKQDVTDYKRDLDLTNAIAHVSYKADGVTYAREYFSSAPDQVMAVHLAADKPGKITLKALLSSLHKNYISRKVDNHTLALSLKVKSGVLRGVSYLHVQAAGGKVVVDSKNISVTGANEATFYLTAATNFKNYHDVSGNPEAICKAQIAALWHKSYAVIKAAHIKDYQKYFNKFSIDLGKGETAELPTDERILKFSQSPDPSFISLYAQYGRYLLISSSRPGGGPANLQGLWNNLLTPPWGSKFTTNINLQMNYWPAEVLNLSACSQPFFSIVDDLSKTGHETAAEHYGAPGWVLHHNTDLWRGAAPVNASNHGIWVSGAAWLCHQLWEHYLYAGDKDFLQKRAYPEMKGAAEFFVHSLVKDPKTGFLISTPSNSPEHGGLVAGPTMDHQIIRDLFKSCIEAAKVLNTDKAFADTLKLKYSQIAPNKIGRYGQLQEWLEDKDDTTDTHRHVSHMWGVYPGTEINLKTPELLKAAEQSMKYRGDEGTGWSIAWKVNIWARMHEGNHAYLMLSKLLSPADVTSGKEKGGVYHNLFDAHPPFQIDGNFGGAAGLAEMLLQSPGDAIELLPALPTALPQGSIKGICARGGFVLDFEWQNGRLKNVGVFSKLGNTCRLCYGGKTTDIETQKGKSYRFDADLKQL
ncbi:glycoside hydrolase family 95 protein [Mucilaginibacter rubeus]|uniref:Glycoside hydrolase N-terminal domain-containing protein n=1 Tax=Mucilaginibacter rubeus TaxID=2027860 RepID=A0AAE6JGT5_9SPHI|nr:MULTISPECIES: glycoside hydrolase N-terminal domain-containing protein [Mucilaginibacter]QEM05290.1 glycoside hydrolase family 95 protein [Mucilaginibacter rubeus]QEM17881.1 glycoside hydrolase family 95 protein [Mucilaginibacter gossypii]QTE45587.1 glycoside hydrolase N-terminal domain-containing protein [Mucilaginibacter rubeus]QTE52184.1 glycoside hydrolase N-terminal domain-containing protein [Mucilaginibacter rubeus]QTE57272.1 glycoside hydrolase N-terminal domain-containing protein [M